MSAHCEASFAIEMDLLKIDSWVIKVISKILYRSSY